MLNYNKKKLYLALHGMIFFRFILPFWLFAAVSFSQENVAKKHSSWNLQQCIDYAQKNNIRIKQQQLNADVSKAAWLQSQAAVFPSLNGNASYVYNFGQTIDPFTNTFATNQVLSQNFSLSTNVTLFSGLQKYNTIQKNKFDYMAGKHDVEKAMNDVTLNIAAAYLQILFADESAESARNQVTQAKKQAERTQKLVDAGSFPRGNLLEMEAQVAAEELALTNAENQVTLAYLNLQQLLDLDISQEFKIEKPDLNMPVDNFLAGTPEQAYKTAVSTLPEIKSAEFRLKSSEKELEIARGGIYPRLSAGASYGSGYSGARKRVTSATPNGFDTTGAITSAGDLILTPAFNYTQEITPFSNQINDNQNKTVGFFLTVPIFNGLQNKTSISIAKIQAQNTRLNLELQKNNVEKTIQQSYADAVAALKKYHAAQKTTEAMVLSFKYTEQKYDVNLINATDYADSKNKLIKAKSDLIQAKYDFVFKVKILDFYQGKEISLK